MTPRMTPDRLAEIQRNLASPAWCGDALHRELVEALVAERMPTCLACTTGHHDNCAQDMDACCCGAVDEPGIIDIVWSENE